MAVLALLFALQDRVADAVRALDADDPDARAAAVRTLIELEADVTEIAKSADGEKELRAQEVVTAVALFRRAPGLRALWRSGPRRVTAALIETLATAPMERWPHLLSPAAEGLGRDARKKLAADVLADSAASIRCLDSIGSTFRLRDFSEIDTERPVALWWFCLEALESGPERGRVRAAQLLSHAVGRLPIDAVDEISAVMLARLTDRDRTIALFAAYALASTARRLKTDGPRLRALVEALAAHLPRKDPAALWALSNANDVAVQESVIARMRPALQDPRALVRSNAIGVLYTQSLPTGPLLDAVARALIPLLGDPEPSVRTAALYALRDRAPYVRSDALLVASVRAFLARLDDEDAGRRQYAAGAISYVARKTEPARLGVLLAPSRAALDARLKRETHVQPRMTLSLVALELDEMLERRDEAIANAKSGLESDDIDTRSTAVRALIELDADTDHPDIAPAVRLFRTAPGCRQAWRLRSDVMPATLVTKLLDAPRENWPVLIDAELAPEALTFEVRAALASDLPTPHDPTTPHDPMPWWSALATLETAGAEHRRAAPALGTPPAGLPEAMLRDIAAALVRTSCVGSLTADPRLQRHAVPVLCALLRERHTDALAVIRDFHPRADDMDAIVGALALAVNDPDVGWRRDVLLTLEARAWYASEKTFAAAMQSLLPRLDDEDADCRRHAARTLASASQSSQIDLERTAAAVESALRRENNDGARTWLEEAMIALRRRLRK